ncbi:TPA: hypothetical protein RG728_002733 [Morganella morganii subsp. morganii]|uniref:Type IV / VI secretion system DotU domain-containing protein n=1 Tax=Morganella morganii TaxID=582 RepID=A0AAU8ZMU5_MORMO|nr:hypothetical protein [Morganella morganii]HDU8693598.1 hypothetical protein [Morganella morganii subsp. morganii]AWC94177.1 hypothetical protein AM380_11280 [Morganella morganii]EKW8487884.1 hypothetical protein [Morganella morganii]HAT3625959.1 hypothetical protein [Morganella morganii]HCU0879692.1 hypothetical protein [Morganella morganii]
MVNSQDVFNKIMCIDALIDLEAIIPSLSELQMNLSTAVQQFRDCLEPEDPYFEHSENFCRLLCIYLDKIILKYTDSQQLSWAPYLLENYFYGFDREPFDVAEQLTFFSSVKRNAVFLPAYQMALRLSGLPEYKTALKPVIPLFEKRLPTHPVAEPVPPAAKIPDATEYPPPVSYRTVNMPLIFAAEILCLILILIFVWLYIRDTLDTLI